MQIELLVQQGLLNGLLCTGAIGSLIFLHHARCRPVETAQFLSFVRGMFRGHDRRP